MRLFGRAVLVAVLVASLGAPNPGAASAIGLGSCVDATPPVLKDLALSRATVNVVDASKSILVTARIAADANKVTSVVVGATPPGVDGVRIGAALELTAGTTSRGTWKGKLRIPRYSLKGQWTLQLDLSDQARSRHIPSTELTAAGFPGSFRVRSDPDYVPPNVRDLSFTPSSVDTTNGGQYVRITSTVREVGSRVRWFEATFRRDVWGKGSYGAKVAMRRVPATSRFVGRVFIPARADHDVTASWRLSVSLVDQVANIRQLDPVDLQNRGWPSTLAIVNRGDPHGPRLESLTIAPDTVDGQTQPAIAVRADATSHGSDPAYGLLTLQSPEGDGDIPTARVPVVSSAGTQSVLKANLWLGCDAQVGTYTVVSFYLNDRVGNYRAYWSTELADLNATTNFTVTG